jgi:hypothetical protein
MILPIYTYGQTVLKKETEEIDENYEGLEQLIKDMFETVRSAEGVGLAAPQITYLMHELKERGLDVDTSAVTVSEAKRSIEKALRERKKNRRS